MKRIVIHLISHTLDLLSSFILQQAGSENVMFFLSEPSSDDYSPIEPVQMESIPLFELHGPE